MIVLLGLMLCEGTRTLSGLLRQIADGASLAGLSRFLSQAPWEAAAVIEQWLGHFREEMQPKVATELERQRKAQPKRRGRPKPPVVTGYVTLDDSTIEKRKGKKMEGLGLPHSTTQDKRVRGHSLVESLYVLLGRRCPLAPQLYRQQAVCEAEGVPFASKIDLFEAYYQQDNRQYLASTATTLKSCCEIDEESIQVVDNTGTNAEQKFLEKIESYVTPILEVHAPASEREPVMASSDGEDAH